METYVGFNMKKSKETTLKPEKALEQDTILDQSGNLDTGVAKCGPPKA
jgi:hypothetical protein